MSLAEFLSRHRRLLGQLYAATPASSWGLSLEQFAQALQQSAERQNVQSGIEEYLGALHCRDIALAFACSCGHEAAWRQFYEELREPLRAAGRSLAGPNGDELADGLFGELYEHRERLATFGGRSSLAGWLRAVLYQTYINRLRAGKKLESLDEREEAGAPPPTAPIADDPAESAVASQYERIAQRALSSALQRLPARQKLLLDFYYFHGLTLREACALVGVHEATASRELERARKQLKKSLMAILRGEYRLDEREARQCLYQAAKGTLAIEESLQERRAPAVQK